MANVHTVIPSVRLALWALRHTHAIGFTSEDRGKTVRCPACGRTFDLKIRGLLSEYSTVSKVKETTK